MFYLLLRFGLAACIGLLFACLTVSFLYVLFKQIVNWRTHLKFPEEAKLSSEAKDLIGKLLCNVNQRLGSKGAHEIKVLYGVFDSMFSHPFRGMNYK